MRGNNDVWEKLPPNILHHRLGEAKRGKEKVKEKGRKEERIAEFGG
jgi:hypothetical protein